MLLPCTKSVFHLVLHFQCESYDDLLSLLIIGTAFRGVGHLDQTEYLANVLQTLPG